MLDLKKNPLINREQAIHSACINNRSAVATGFIHSCFQKTLRCSLATRTSHLYIGDNMFKRFLIAAVFLVMTGFGLDAVAGDVYVNGYYKSNGTYVQPHFRSAPDGNLNNNWSTRGNVNPYTGKLGTRNSFGNNLGSGFGSNSRGLFDQPSSGGLFDNQRGNSRKKGLFD